MSLASGFDPSHPFRPTTLVRSPRLSAKLGVDVTVASEAFQYTGSFKFRAAYTLAKNVPNQHVITASSGNFGQALAFACFLLNKRCHVVMPHTSAKVKIEAVKEYGAEVDIIDVNVTSRTERLANLANEFPDAYAASPFDDDWVIAGNSSLAQELMKSGEPFDAVVTPVGGGGLASGLVKGFGDAGRSIHVIGAEPAMANDAARSIRAGHLLPNDAEPQTIADGARTLSLGNLNWEILRAGLNSVVEVSEESIKEGLRLLFNLANLKVEPTGALSVGAVLQEPSSFESYSRVCCVVSGGNVDPALFTALL